MQIQTQLWARDMLKANSSVGANMQTRIHRANNWVVERMSLELARKVGVPVKIFRLGQMYSHTETGSWNFSEM